MPQRRLLASTLAGLLAMAGFPGIGPSTAAQAQSEQDCEDADCVAEDQVGADESDSLEEDADAEAQSRDEFVDESAMEGEDQSFVAEQEPEADVAQAGEEEEESADFAGNDVPEADQTPAATPDPPAPTVTSTQPAQDGPAPPASVPASAVRTQIRTFMERHLNGATFADSDDIFALGYVNSIFAMKLVQFCESTLGVQVEAEDLDVGNFRSVDNMAAFVQRKQGR